jgi:hypothetical protein
VLPAVTCEWALGHRSWRPVVGSRDHLFFPVWPKCIRLGAERSELLSAIRDARNDRTGCRVVLTIANRALEFE